MLHAFDGLDELEPTVEWGGKEGRMRVPQEAGVCRSTMTPPPTIKRSISC
ncbi:unnamed protein product [Pylaiella littoralis]